jgi:hypothetical protein
VVLKHLLGEIRLEDVLGRIILVPVLNPSAFHAGLRESADDGVNLNRAFVEGAGRPSCQRHTGEGGHGATGVLYCCPVRGSFRVPHGVRPASASR